MLVFFNDTAPYQTVSISSYSISPSSSTVGSTITLSISALNAQSVWAVVTSPNSQEQTINLINDNSVSFVPSPSVVGTYSATFYANSSTGAIASAIDSFVFTAQTTTPSGGPSGGGTSGSGVKTIEKIEKCDYNWDCTPWSVCSNGNQTRKCVNIGTCEGEEKKPIEQRICSDSLFDIKLTDLEITKCKNKSHSGDDIFHFKVHLIETQGVEKIDVHIKYSIIDEKGYEVFSQIKTIAVEKELIYDKEIKDIELEDGKYILRVDILYGNLQRAFAQQDFVIKNGILSYVSQKIFIYNFLIILGCLIVLIALIALIIFMICKLIKRCKLIKSIKLKKTAKSNKVTYKSRIRQNLNKIKSKKTLIIITCLITIGTSLILKSSITGFVTGEINITNNNKNIIGFILIISLLGLLVFFSKIKIIKNIKFIKAKKSSEKLKNSLNELIGKKVYTKEGNYIGNVNNLTLHKNKIDSLKIKLDKKYNFNAKGIFVNYKNVDNVGQIVIVDNEILQKLNL